jgi:hypothetical protein
MVANVLHGLPFLLAWNKIKFSKLTLVSLLPILMLKKQESIDLFVRILSYLCLYKHLTEEEVLLDLPISIISSLLIIFEDQTKIQLVYPLLILYTLYLRNSDIQKAVPDWVLTHLIFYYAK